ncbi:MAG: hypothetical protein DWQ31_00780 [Planctomycetota bacterium]|nr:MAG: hypothetical protein DWQ31_00780 [Planctomycetota bacterium]REJ87254.1 MAG: hypothetical protein DWQ35_21780 [Planctomycetota bacterium]REK31564.1 MAG: hypothetical protein DWQ42_00290 [Planctomycetota bacterium]REK43098.1 MAG: hypothetical protein DWQ46_12040 [Planctomycetota bacterium]
MTGAAPETTSGLRRGVYALLIALAAGSATGRILAVNSVNLTVHERERIKAATERRKADLIKQGFEGEALENRVARIRAEYEERLQLQRPFLSGNDRSRWCTIRALVDDGTYQIEQIVANAEERSIWNTIDMIKHRGWDGQPHLYSTKPPLFPTLVAGEYWLIKRLTGLTLADHTFTVVRIILITVNVGSLIVFLLVLARIVERYGTTDWGRLVVMATAAAGTFLCTFAVALNNHLVAAVAVIVALDATLRILYEGERRWRFFALAVAAGTFAAATELPALLFLALFGLALLWKCPRETLLAGAPAFAVVMVAALGTNYLAHGGALHEDSKWLDPIKPPYAFRDRGADEEGKPRDWTNGNWYNYTYEIHDPRRPDRPPRVVQSYWSRDEESLARRSRIDLGEPSRATYALHMLIGHHGIFSLTPIWLFSMAGMVALCLGRGESPTRLIGAIIAVVTVVVFTFYLMQTQENRNYGGMTSGLRWTFWLAPLWLLALLPAADWSSGSRLRRVVIGVCLAFSVMSASYPTWNPWTHPWLGQLLAHLGWIEL